MEVLFGPGSIWLVALLVGCWCALMCLKVLAAQIEQNRKLRQLRIDTRRLQEAYRIRLERLQEATGQRQAEPQPVRHATHTMTAHRDEPTAQMSDDAPPPLAQAA
ncbi:MAG TPA: hypothetical protein PK400_02690 [Phycisphaerales bacterium]|nr:hypothetical protein [Phycisphaerales bacterium]HRQ74401.1 hypothetical protein [Phycisphaerales bacterium]